MAGLGPDQFGSRDQIEASCDKFNAASAFVKEHGMTFGIHNHWWEFLQVEDQLVYRTMQEFLDPDVFFQIDAYWVQTAGPDPAGVIRELGARAPLIHVKDGPCTREADMQALGEGIVDFKNIADAAEHVDWIRRSAGRRHPPLRAIYTMSGTCPHRIRSACPGDRRP